jgi:hypothetical protein
VWLGFSGPQASCHNDKKFREELIVYFPLLRDGQPRKRRLQQFFVAAGMSLANCYLATIGYTDRPTNAILLLLRVFIAAGTSLPSRCLTTKGGIHFTELLPSKTIAGLHTQKHRLMGGILLSTPLRWAQLP